MAAAGQYSEARAADTLASAVRIRRLCKRYPGVVALRGVEFDLPRRHTRALVGENGAGKTTLIKVIAGAVPPDSGLVEIGGDPVYRFSPLVARSLGVSVIHQERQAAHDLSVAENVLLGRLPERGTGLVDWRRTFREAARLLEQVGLEVDVRSKMAELTVAEQQAVEVARALGSDARILILDEPTASLGASERTRLFAIVRRLKEAGRAILYVSHHLDEVFQIADSVSVMRDGAIVATEQVEDVTAAELTKLMFGTDVKALEQHRPFRPSARPIVLHAKGIHFRRAVRGVTLAVRAGEVLCIAGGLASGRRELARVLAGAIRPDKGTITIGDFRRNPRSPRDALKRGLGFMSDDRKRDGLLADLDLVENIDLSRLAIAKGVVTLAPRRRRHAVTRLIQTLSIRVESLNRPISQLSGGNQQKALLARLLNSGAKILVLDEPTAGVDVSTRLELYGLLRSLSRAGSSLIVFSSDYEEVEVLADRAIVLNRGRIAGELHGSEISKDALRRLEVGV